MKCNIEKYFKNVENYYYLKDITGAKVKINIDKIIERNTLNHVEPNLKFYDFLRNSRDKEFTAVLDSERGYTKMYTLEEDESEVKWLFHIEDLTLVK